MLVETLSPATLKRRPLSKFGFNIQNKLSPRNIVAGAAQKENLSRAFSGTINHATLAAFKVQTQ
jgi:hypothetical protein